MPVVFVRWLAWSWFGAAYVLICVFGFNMIALAASREPDRAMRLWMYGAAASAIIHLFPALCTATGHPLPPIPGPLGASSFRVVRRLGAIRKLRREIAVNPLR
jgi:hypothetical protein